MSVMRGAQVLYSLLADRIQSRLVHPFDIHNPDVYENKKLKESMSSGATAFQFYFDGSGETAVFCVCVP